MTKIILKNTGSVLNVNSISRGKTRPRKKYVGTILFANGIYGDVSVIQSDFGKLPDSEVFHLHQKQFISEVMKHDIKIKNDFGSIYHFDGYYRLFKNGSGRFVGEINKVM